MLPLIRNDFGLNWENNSLSLNGKIYKLPEREFEILAVLLNELQFISLTDLKVKVLGRMKADQVDNTTFISDIKKLRHSLSSENLPVRILFPGKAKCLLQIEGSQQ